MTDVRTARCNDLDAATLEAARALLYDVFDDMTEDDWEHSLGEVHTAWDGRTGRARFYAARGWTLWQGPSSALTPTGLQCTEEDDAASTSCR